MCIPILPRVHPDRRIFIFAMCRARPFLLATLVTLLLVLVALAGSAESKRRPRISQVTYNQYELEPPPGRLRRWLDSLARTLHLPQRTTTPKEWKTKVERKHGAYTMEERIAHMEALDRRDEELYQEHLLKHTPLLIISPTLATMSTVAGASVTNLGRLSSAGGLVARSSPSAGSTSMTAAVQGGYSVLYPTIFAGDMYHVAFRIGAQYPKKRPYLSVFLTTCSGDRPDKKGIRFIRTMFVNSDRSVSDVERTTGEVFTSWRSPEAMDTLKLAANGASFFRWDVPAKSLFPGKKYCLLFDMSSVNPASVTAGGTGVFDLDDFKPGFSLHSTKHFHRLLSSPRFEILAQPQMYTEDWFARLYGGKDLMVFIGGRMFAFRFFQVVYNNEEGQWSQALFHQDAKVRACVVGQWLVDMLRTHRSRSAEDGSTVAQFDTGYAAVEDRREARSRAIGLLFHPHGRQTLKFIGEAFLRIANSYHTTLRSFGRYNDAFLNGLLRGMGKLYEEYVGSFARARRKVAYWAVQLRDLLGGLVPEEELLESFAGNFGGKKRMYVRELKRKMYSPTEIHRKILKHMTTMVRHEIDLVIWEVGAAVLRRRGTADRWVDVFFGTSFYSYAKYIDFASTLKLIGTKFVGMATNFEFEEEASGGSRDGASHDEESGSSSSSSEESDGDAKRGVE